MEGSKKIAQSEPRKKKDKFVGGVVRSTANHILRCTLSMANAMDPTVPAF